MPKELPSDQDEDDISRRQAMQQIGLAGLGLLIGCSGAKAIEKGSEPQNLSFKNVPTVDLHRHWEAGMSPETIAIIAQRNRITELKTPDGKVIQGVDPQNPESVRAYAKSIVDGFKGPNGFTNFLTAFRALSSVLKTEEDVEFAIFEQLREEQAAGSIHTELRGSPASLIKPLGGVSLEKIILAMQSGVDKAYRELGMSGTLITCFSRDKGIGDPKDILKNQAENLVRALLNSAIHDADRPIGLDIAGAPEIKFPPEKFKDVLAPAMEAGVPITVHAGEQCKPPDFAGAPASFIGDAVLELNAKRIGHAVSLMDPAAGDVRELVRDHGVGIEACPPSNDKMGIVGLDGHPLKGFLAEGILVSIATDDPLFFGVASVREMLMKHGVTLGLTPQDALQLTKNAIQTAFVTEKRRAELWRKLN